MVRQFTTSTSDERFDEDFTVATNKALDELSVAGDLDTYLNHIDTHDATISDLDKKHTLILMTGITYHLLIQGQLKTGKADHLMLAREDWKVAKGNFMIMMQREDEETVDDDDNPTGDIIGLGYKS